MPSKPEERGYAIEAAGIGDRDLRTAANQNFSSGCRAYGGSQI